LQTDFKGDERNGKQSSSDINRAINDLLEKSNRVKISGLKGQNNIAIGLTGNPEIDIKGDAGRYLGAFNSGPVIILQGSCGDLAGSRLINGGIIVMGSCGKKCGLGMTGGLLVVRGDCGTNIGFLNRNGTIIVDGDVKGNAGSKMSGGTIIISGDVKGVLGENSRGGNFFVRGIVNEIGDGITEMKADRREISRIGKYLDHYGISAVSTSFKKYSIIEGE
jgi:glutamate synthase domain-containing protein 3